MATIRTFNPNPHNMLELRRALQMLRIQVPPSSYDQVALPTEDDDITKGWRIGSTWIAVIPLNGTSITNIFECADNAEGAAIWKQMVDLVVGEGGVAAPSKGILLGFDVTTGKWNPLTVGSNDEALIADSGETLGLKWGPLTAADSHPIDDTTGIVKDADDATRIVRFDAGSITTGNTRVITMLDADIDLADVVTGPASATDTKIARYDGATGKKIDQPTADWRIKDGSTGDMTMGGDIDVNGGDRYILRGSAKGLQFVLTPGDVNWFKIASGSSGNPPAFSAQGETNVSLNLVPKGTGTLQSAGVDVILADGSVALTGPWDNTGERIRNTGVAEVTGVEPTTPATGLVWLDTGATGTGGLGVLNVTTITTDTTLTGSQTVVLCDAASGAITVTLPAASGNDGRRYMIKKTDSSANAVTLDANGSETIDDGLTAVLLSQYEAVSIVSDGSNWHIL